MPFCANCGTEVNQGVRFCPNCGVQTQAPGAQAQTPVQPQQQSYQPSAAPQPQIIVQQVPAKEKPENDISLVNVIVYGIVGIILAGILFIFLLAYVFPSLSRGYSLRDSVSLSRPEYRIFDVNVDDSCAAVRDYCIQVRCTIQNVGNAAGSPTIQITVEGDSAGMLAKSKAITLASGAMETIIQDFPEATLGGEHLGRCKVMR